MEINEHFSSKAKQDILLVEQALQGSQKAYTELLDRYRDTIYFMLLKMVKNKNDAEDLTIEAFGKAFKNLEQYTSDFAFSTWLFRIASNNCIDFLRKRKTITVSIDENFEKDEYEYSFNIESSDLNPEENFIKSQNSVQLSEIVKKMKPRYRELIELRYFKEFAYEEIAQHMNLPLGTVKAQLFRARELLYNVLQRTH
ncbi:MAG TPA: sigma-70 family RNA polymerase sigma factor [Bacteroidales bacterium]|nr:MAG: ECF RNA polymerase sigma factor SigW [Bacteroidetes bacterium ADurb.Bin217]HPM13635.1 sigma-70 family RNA polymerase sigma factor [Bacteroidales bacterium]